MVKIIRTTRPAPIKTANITSDNCRSVSIIMIRLPKIINSARSSSEIPALENIRTTSTSLDRRVISRPV
jgi:hypothetical protein